MNADEPAPTARTAATARADVFDPRPLRVAVVIAVLFIVAPGSFYGAALLWAFAGGGSVVPSLVPPSTHAMLQLAGGFMTLIWAFLAFGVPHLLGLDMKRARRVIAAIGGVAVALLVDVVAAAAGSSTIVGAARGVGCASAFVGLLLFARARRATPTTLQATLPTAHALRVMPLPFLVAALALYPLAWLAYAIEPLALLPAGVASDAMLFLVVVPVIMSMGWKMFSSLLQLDAGNAPRLAAALGAWLAGGAIVVVARGAPWIAPFASPLLLAGALLWLASLHGLRRRSGDRAATATPGTELRAHVVVAATSLFVSPVLWFIAAMNGPAALVDVARHVLALGFVLAVTMGVTLRVLPRFCRGVPSSPRAALFTLGLLVIGIVLRGARVLEHDVASAFVRASAAITLLAVVLWGAHLLRGLRPSAAARAPRR